MLNKNFKKKNQFSRTRMFILKKKIQIKQIKNKTFNNIDNNNINKMDKIFNKMEKISNKMKKSFLKEKSYLHFKVLKDL